MTNLTEQWNKGELPSGWYYVRLIRGEYRIDLYINGKNEWIDCPDNIIDTVVCEVPSYEELQNELQNQAFILKSRESEITKLRELLKECREHFITYKRDDIDKGYIVYYDGSYLIDEINQVLGEE